MVIVTATFDRLVTTIVKERNKALQTALDEEERETVETSKSVMVTSIEQAAIEFGGGVLVTGT